MGSTAKWDAGLRAPSGGDRAPGTRQIVQGWPVGDGLLAVADRGTGCLIAESESRWDTVSVSQGCVTNRNDGVNVSCLMH